MSDDATTAVLAHGLLNAAHVVGSVPELLLEGPSKAEANRLCTMLSEQLSFLAVSLEDLGGVVSDNLRQDLHRAVLAGDVVTEACAAGQLSNATDALHVLDDAAQRAAAMLSRLVQGLPSDVVEYLDSLHGSSW